MVDFGCFKFRWTVYSAFLAVFGSLLKHHTPNFGWCGLYPTLDRFLSVSHGELFRGTFASVMRPSLHLEKLLGHACGMACVNTYYYIAYCLALFATSLIISWPLMQLAGCKDIPGQVEIKRAAIFILAALPVYVHVFSYGSIVDAFYPAASVGIVALFMLRKTSNHALPPFFSCFKGNGWAKALTASILVFVLDMSRPYAPYVILLFLGAAFFQKSKSMVLGILLGLLISLPYHMNQYSGISSPILTNYTGCNLMEVFRAPGVAFPGSMSEIPQAEIAQRCAKNADLIKSYIFDDPVSALSDVLSPLRLIRSVFPAPFTPWHYRYAPSLFSVDGFLQWALWLAFAIFLYAPIVFLVIKFLPGGFSSDASSGLVSLAVFLPVAFSVLANAAEEAGRVGLSFVLPIIFLVSVFALDRPQLASHKS